MPTAAETFDAIIVGAGQAGPPLAGRLITAGQTVAVIERKLVGGTCVNSGCIPTKTLVASAHAAHTARRGADYGVGTGKVAVDMRKVKARKDEIMLDDRHGVESWLEGMDNCTLIRGHARFEDPHTVRVADQILKADKIFLNVGGRAVVPDMPGLSDIDYMTNVGVLRSGHAANPSSHHRRQLHRAGVRPDVPALRCARHDRRKRATPDLPRGRRRIGRNQGDLRKRGDRHRAERHRNFVSQARQRFRGDT